jgi:hypothetical protein
MSVMRRGEVAAAARQESISMPSAHRFINKRNVPLSTWIFGPASSLRSPHGDHENKTKRRAPRNLTAEISKSNLL